MSRLLYYYAKLNENNICFGFEVLPKKFSKMELPSNLILLEGQNESYLYKKWNEEVGAFSSDSYEPEFSAELQDMVELLRDENDELKSDVSALSQNITLLEGTITELTMILAS